MVTIDLVHVNMTTFKQNLSCQSNVYFFNLVHYCLLEPNTKDHHKLSILRFNNGNCEKFAPSWFVHFTRWYWALKIHLTHRFVGRWGNLRDIFSFIVSYFICWHIYSCVKRLFNAWYSCVKCMNLWMKEVCTIFIINLFHTKFVRMCIHMKNFIHDFYKGRGQNERT